MAPLSDGPDLIFPETVSAATGGEVSTETVRRFCRQGRFPGARKIGRSWVIPEADATEFLRVYDPYRPWKIGASE